MVPRSRSSSSWCRECWKFGVSSVSIGIKRSCLTAWPPRTRTRPLPLCGPLPLRARGERARVTGDLRGSPGGKAEAQGVQFDEALGVALVVDHVLLEGDVGEAVEALRRLSPR